MRLPSIIPTQHVPDDPQDHPSSRRHSENAKRVIHHQNPHTTATAFDTLNVLPWGSGQNVPFASR